MGILDIFKGNEYKAELEEIKAEYEKVKAEYEKVKNEKLSVEKMDALELQNYIDEKNTEIQTLNEKIEKLKSLEKDIDYVIDDKSEKLENIKAQLVDTEERVYFESHGLYTPKYDFATSIGYKAKLDEIRKQQKQMIKDKTAVNYFNGWTVNNSKSQGKKMTNDNIKMILRSFNNECEAAINKVKFSNLTTIEKRILKSFEQLNKLNEINRVSISPSYLDAKIKELYLAYEYERKKEDEKEELREQRQREREEKALQKEIDKKKKVIDKDIKHYQNMIDELQEKLKALSDSSEKEELNKQLLELHEKVEEKQEEKQELDYRTANASAGYVYIISNIGAFGNDVFKIGVTRRLDPLERIGELSSASVPFKFDVHALIFSYDAYKLESELHNYFDKYRVNKVNNRKEFFKVPIEEIERKLEEYKDLTIDFSKDADAEEYRQSIDSIEELSK